MLHQLHRALGNVLSLTGVGCVRRLVNEWNEFFQHFGRFVCAGLEPGNAAARRSIQDYHNFMHLNQVRVFQYARPLHKNSDSTGGMTREQWTVLRWGDCADVLLELLANPSAGHVAGLCPPAACALSDTNRERREATCCGVRYAMGSPEAASQMRAAEVREARAPLCVFTSMLALGEPLPLVHQRGFLESRSVGSHSSDNSIACIMADVIRLLCWSRGGSVAGAPSLHDPLAHTVGGLSTTTPSNGLDGVGQAINPLSLFLPPSCKGAPGTKTLVCPVGKQIPGSIEAYVATWSNVSAKDDTRDPRRILATRALKTGLESLQSRFLLHGKRSMMNTGRASVGKQGRKVKCMRVAPEVITHVRERARALMDAERARLKQFAELLDALGGWSERLIEIGPCLRDRACTDDELDVLLSLAVGSPETRTAATERAEAVLEACERRAIDRALEDFLKGDPFGAPVVPPTKKEIACVYQCKGRLYSNLRTCYGMRESRIQCEGGAHLS